MSNRQSTRPDYIKWLLLIGAAALVVVLLGYVGWRYVLPHSVSVDRYRYPVAGIDVSKHNGAIDFERVAAAGYQFVFIKASEGKSYRDAAFNDNYAGARDAGLMVGAYHFFRKNRTGSEQAANLLGVVGGKRLDLPLVIDLEDDWGNGATVGRATTIERVQEMVSILSQRGYQVMVYTNMDGYNKYYKDLRMECDLWLCSFTNPDLLPTLPHVIQQYSHEGNVDGVKGEVDLNIYRGSKKQWHRYLDSIKQPK